MLASDLDNRWNDFPLHATFVPFIHEAMRYLSGGARRRRIIWLDDAPAGHPGRARRRADAAGAGGRPRSVAVNVDPAESDAGAADRGRVSDRGDAAQGRRRAPSTRVEGREQEERQHLWQYVLA